MGILRCFLWFISAEIFCRKVYSNGGFAQACSVGEVFNINRASGFSLPCSVQKKGQTVLVPFAKSSRSKLKYCPHERIRSGGALHLSVGLEFFTLVWAMLVAVKHE